MNLKLKAKILLGTMLLTSVSNFGGIVSAANKRGHVRTPAVLRSRDDLTNREMLDFVLREAIYRGDRGRVQNLLNMGLNFSTLNSHDRFSALELAVFRGFANVVRAVLSAGERNPDLSVDVNATSNNFSGATLLDTAVLTCPREYVVDVVGALLEHGADPNRANRDGSTVLMGAISSGYVGVVKVLLEHGADPNKAIPNGITPLDMAVHKNNREIANALLTHGAIGNALNVQLAIETSYDPDLSTVCDLLQQGADLKALDQDRLANVLCMAAEEGDLDLVNSVLRVNPDIINDCNLNGTTALICATAEGHLEVVRALLRNGADVNEFDLKGLTAMCWADSDDVRRELMHNGADINAVDNDYGTVLHRIMGRSLVLTTDSTLRSVLDLGADVNAKYPGNGYTPLHCWVKGACKCSDFDFENISGFVVELLKRGADPNIVNNQGETPLALAKHLNDERVVNVLEKAIKDANA